MNFACGYLRYNQKKVREMYSFWTRSITVTLPCVYESLTTTSSEDIFLQWNASELLENLEGIFPSVL